MSEKPTENSFYYCFCGSKDFWNSILCGEILLTDKFHMIRFKFNSKIGKIIRKEVRKHLKGDRK